MTQFNYAGLDARAGVLLFYHVHQRTDPIFTEPQPDVAALPADTTLRLYSLRGQGTLVDYGERTWGAARLVVGRRQGRASRMVVRLTKKHVPGAMALHPQEDNGEPQALDQLQLGTCLLYTSPSPRDGLLSRMPSSA